MIKMIEDETYYAEISPNIWIMDNHRWAFCVWEKYFNENKSAALSLIHIDYHWDSVNDFKKEEDIQYLIDCDLESILSYMKNSNLILDDSFIAPAIIRGRFKTVYFYCRQYDNEAGLDYDLLKRDRAKQKIITCDKSLSRLKIKGKYILDIDLDVFNDSNESFEGKLWSNEKIYKFLASISEIIRNSEIITIAYSFGTGYIGDEEGAQVLLNQVFDFIQNLRPKNII